ACGQPEPVSVSFERPVVVAEHPLALDNPQQSAIRWPLWGGAFAIGELAIRTSLRPTGASGLIIAGPGDEQERVAVELVFAGHDTWTLRETVGDQLVQERSEAISE